MKIELHVFTNCTKHIEYHQPIFKTIESFKETFGDLVPHIWVDKSPNVDAARAYLKNITKHFKHVKMVQSFSDGYIRSIKESECDFLFMLEHDWTFNKECITHTLEEICKVMKEDKIHHFRFSKIDNDALKDEGNHWHYPISYINGSLPYHTVQSASNNPHIINKELYVKDLMHRLRVEPGSLGIEHNLICVDNANFCIYGSPNLPATINHIDGRLAYVNK